MTLIDSDEGAKIFWELNFESLLNSTTPTPPLFFSSLFLDMKTDRLKKRRMDPAAAARTLHLRHQWYFIDSIPAAASLNS